MAPPTVSEGDCLAQDTDLELGFPATLGVFLILISGVGISAVLSLMEYATRGRLRNREPSRKRSVMVDNLMMMTEKEKLLLEMSRMRDKMKEKDKIIQMLRKQQQQPKEVHQPGTDDVSTNMLIC